MATDRPSRPDTYFAPPGRSGCSEIDALAHSVRHDPILQVVIRAIAGHLMLLDRHRQIIAANDSLLQLLGVEEGQSILGLRYGEAFRCVNATRGPSGCGTSAQCRHCGAVLAVLAAQSQVDAVEGECTLTCCQTGSPMLKDYKIHVCPLTLGAEPVLAVVFHDITANKWRELHERLFVHDLSNLVTGLSGWTEELANDSAGEAARQMLEISARLNEHLVAHRLLMQCEAGSIQLQSESIEFDALARALLAHAGPSGDAPEFRLRVDNLALPDTLTCDRRLLLRVLENLLRNALEACPHHKTVQMTFETSGHHSLFRVHHPGVMPSEVAARLFSALFSTKGPGRGLGMYSVQVFGEHLLGGQISWDSSEDRGTTFLYSLPNSRQ